MASVFIHDTDFKNKVFRKEFLDISKLDYSLESLKQIDEYLEKIRLVISIDTDDYFFTVLRAGAYCGEVIRKEVGEENLAWIAYSSIVNENEKLENKQQNLDSSYILSTKDSLRLSPMSKVQKYILNGEEDSLYSYAQTFVDQIFRKENT